MQEVRVINIKVVIVINPKEVINIKCSKEVVVINSQEVIAIMKSIIAVM